MVIKMRGGVLEAAVGLAPVIGARLRIIHSLCKIKERSQPKHICDGDGSVRQTGGFYHFGGRRGSGHQSQRFALVLRTPSPLKGFSALDKQLCML